MNHTARYLACLLCAGLLSSCEILDGSGDDRGTFPPLEATEWFLVELDGRRLFDQPTISLEFTEATTGGYAGCNWYGGAYAADSQGLLSFAELVHTERLCLDPPGVMEREARYFDTLLQVQSYRVVAGRLELRDADGHALLVYQPSLSTPQP